MKFLAQNLLALMSIIETVAFVMTPCKMQLSSGQPERRNVITKFGKLLPLVSIQQMLPKHSHALTPDEINQIKIYDMTLPSVCYIVTDYNVTKSFPSQNPKGIGSGFIYDTVTPNVGHIVTNFHVIHYAKNATVKFINKNGIVKEYIPKVTGYDIDNDIAVLQIEIPSSDNIQLRPMPMSSDKNIKVGQNCYAIGAPFAKEWSFTSGIISGKGRELTAPSGRMIKNIIQSDTPINKGNSGGCLINSDGELIGINTAIIGGDVSTGISFSISVDTVKTTVNNILKTGIIEHPTLGITYLERLPSEQEALQSGVPFVKNGVVILELSETASPLLQAAKRQLNNKFIYGDIIVGINKCDINTPHDLLAVLEHYKPKDKIDIRVLRGNKLEEVTIPDIELGSDKDITLGLQMV